MLKNLFYWLIARRSIRLPQTQQNSDFESLQDHCSEVVPYDENLLERARNQWQFGDWESLAKLDRETLQHHPERAKLALLAAAGHQQQNNITSARHFTLLAHEWGCNKRHIAQVLISGTYNTLGRAAEITQNTSKASSLFESAIAIGSPGSDIKLLSRARRESQFSQLGISWKPTSITLPISDYRQGTQLKNESFLIKKNQKVNENAELQNLNFLDALQNQTKSIEKIKKEISSSLKSEMANAVKQLEAFINIRSYFDLNELVPELHGWPISPDFALYLIQLIQENKYDAIIELGSGTSTVLIATTLKKARAKENNPITIQLAFEHLEIYYDKTMAELVRHQLDKYVNLHLTPLQNFISKNGDSYSYYNCLGELKRLSIKLKRSSRVLVVVDGPPGATCKHARYPAMPIILDQLADVQLDFLLDDYIRKEEKEVVQKWMADLDSGKYDYSVIEKKMEKDACLIRIAERNST